MQNPKTIIELDYKFDESQIIELEKFLLKYYDIYKHEIEIYDIKDYSKQSFFAQTIAEEVQKEMALEND
ncbi:hypothetical protein KO488_08050 [Poseidonibacter lekithochrous]|uniref:hypothetical protein n=1 Tax=Poseidonibacter TaxID=2321187 RepID=UPI001C088827|nr:MULTISPECIES: hypothetical protein [Poseidonibacter]MBU3014705.1 hypothetical protein [Poseidonibacter lekithochrous]MDO6828003.1 hypothetical protein [Poseidonibacter sp. 1_MG-2023]